MRTYENNLVYKTLEAADFVVIEILNLDFKTTIYEVQVRPSENLN